MAAFETAAPDSMGEPSILSRSQLMRSPSRGFRSLSLELPVEPGDVSPSWRASRSSSTIISKTSARSACTCATKRAKLSPTRNKLFETPEWRERFGRFNRPYRDRYRPVPFHRGFVRHMEGWYAQKHPDEDFAETFAVWLTPRSRWRQRYRGWPAMDKLRYVDRVAHKVGDVEPVVRLASTDITVEEMNMTVEEFFRSQEPEARPVDVALEHDLTDLFIRRRKGLRAAAEFVREHRAGLINKIEYWTGVRRSVVRALVDRMVETSDRLRGSVLSIKRRRSSSRPPAPSGCGIR